MMLLLGLLGLKPGLFLLLSLLALERWFAKPWRTRRLFDEELLTNEGSASSLLSVDGGLGEPSRLPTTLLWSPAAAAAVAVPSCSCCHWVLSNSQEPFT